MKISFLHAFFLQLSLQQVSAASLINAISSKHEDLVSKLSNYRLVRPYRSTPDGEFLSFDLSTSGEEVVKRRYRRGTEEFHFSTNYHFVVESVDGDYLLLNVEKKTDLFAPNVVVEKFTEEGGIVTEKPFTDCFYQGQVGDTTESNVVISSCEGLSGVIIFGDDEYVIEPVDPNQPLSVTNKTSGGTHIIYRTTDHEDHEDMIDDLMKKIDLTNDAEFLRLFDNSGLRVKRTSHLLPTDQVYYVKIMLVADSSLQDFHGSSTVMYMAKLINFVNMIYAHDTLGLNIKFVIVSVKLLNYCTSRKIICSSAADSLTNANKWAASQNTADDDDPNHFDMSFFLTRNNDGMVGVDGFATIGATCRPSSSAVLVRDVENLRDSFVAAHEAGHMLGLSHVHYYQSCGDDVDSPAIMSRISWSKFHNYFWSSCSRETLYFQLRTGRLDCLEDPPTMTNEEYTYPGLHTTLDEQCRFDYGSAATACQVRGSDPCASLYCQRTPKTLWCGTGSTLRPIRPMEGTMCAENKWCVQGVCRERQNGQSNDSIYEWHEGDWSPCSLTCGGIGVKSRIITCRELRYDSSGRLGVVSDQVDESLCHPDLKPTREAECPTEACSAN